MASGASEVVRRPGGALRWGAGGGLRCAMRRIGRRLVSGRPGAPVPTSGRPPASPLTWGAPSGRRSSLRTVVGLLPRYALSRCQCRSGHSSRSHCACRRAWPVAAPHRRHRRRRTGRGVPHLRPRCSGKRAGPCRPDSLAHRHRVAPDAPSHPTEPTRRDDSAGRNSEASGDSTCPGCGHSGRSESAPAIANSSWGSGGGRSAASSH